MHRTNALTFDPDAAHAWPRRRSGPPGFTAGVLGIDNNLTGHHREDFLSTIDNVLTVDPAGLHRRADIAAVLYALAPIAAQVCPVVSADEGAQPRDQATSAVSR